MARLLLATWLFVALPITRAAQPLNGSSCAHPARQGCEPNHGCHLPECAVIASMPCRCVPVSACVGV